MFHRSGQFPSSSGSPSRLSIQQLLLLKRRQLVPISSGISSVRPAKGEEDREEEEERRGLRFPLQASTERGQRFTASDDSLTGDIAGLIRRNGRTEQRRPSFPIPAHESSGVHTPEGVRNGGILSAFGGERGDFPFSCAPPPYSASLPFPSSSVFPNSHQREQRGEADADDAMSLYYGDFYPVPTSRRRNDY